MTDSSGFRRPESVLVVVYTKLQDVLLIKRADMHDFWQSVTGAFEADEVGFQAAARELAEETGICVDQINADLIDEHSSSLFEIKGVWRKRYHPDTTHNCEHVFSLQLEDRIDVQLDKDEHTEFVWLSATDALERASSATNKQAIYDVILNRVR